ncbi:39S ribosomal protein L47, mitochondrial-like [Penaeus japonicus]|uniref:39S ribosomal protein L47, mitochondrial-like n=1 Tax=Penaeus japonicus TaxID=27405 RepID=UPI001C712039|nr:39S ribosomal protein L47, mitochondrial-like [Penaeus japonicus]
MFVMMATPLRRVSSLLSGTISCLRGLNISSHGARKVMVATANTNYFKTLPCAASFHTSTRHLGLMDFFDDKKNWGEQEVKVGRAWKLDELRIKSNEDLHKLWYVLLKEKNMLLTMEHACKEEYRLFPNPERIDKVEESMKNLEDVVRERNRAYWLLETGETGERPGARVKDELGRVVYKKSIEHLVPIWMHKKSKENIHRGAAVRRFQRHMREKRSIENRRYRRRIRNHVCGLLRRFPNANLEAIQEQFPEVDVGIQRLAKRTRGNHRNIA